MEYILQTNHLCKRYKNQYVLSNVCMNISKGDIYGFVGENGSGKTTIIRLITGLIFPTKGTFELFGVKNTDSNVLKVRNKVGAIVESPSIYHNMTAYENLKTQATILGVNDEEKIKEVLKDVGLFDLYNSNKKARNFSLGMRQRLGIAMALLGNVEFLILDEPMNGLDPAGIVEIRELILKLNKERNITFLISSHILTELALVATKYGIISKGKIIKEISNEQLRNECRKSVIIQTNDNDKLYELLQTMFEKENLINNGNEIKVYGDIDLNKTLSKIIKAKLEIHSIKCSETNIEDYYLSLIGGSHNA